MGKGCAGPQVPGMPGGQIRKRTLDSWREKPAEEGTSQGHTKVRGGKASLRVSTAAEGLPRGRVGPASPLPRAPTFPDPLPTARGLSPPVQSMPERADRLALAVSAAPRAVPTWTHTALLSPRGIWDHREQGAVSGANLRPPEWGGS